MKSLEDIKITIQNNVIPNTPSFVIDSYVEAIRRIKEFKETRILSQIVVLDTETTGISLSKEELTQIACAKVKQGDIKEWLITYVNPKKVISEDISKLTGITEKDVKGAPSPEKAVQKLAEFINDSKIVAHNVEFDRGFITKHKNGMNLNNNVWIDSLEISKILFPRLKSHRLKDIVSTFGGPAPTHKANDDVISTVFLFNLCVSKAMQTDISLINSVRGLSDQKEWSTVNFFNEVFQEKLYSERLKKENVSRETFDLKKVREQAVQSCFKKRKNEGEEKDGKEKEIKKELKFPTEEDVVEFFKKGGQLSNLIENFSERHEQIDLAIEILNNFKQKGFLIAEAGTGIGKSFSYLVVCSLVSLKNNIPIGIATKTNNLLDQLVYKDLPILHKMEEFKDVSFVAVKGMGHYLCLRKLERLVTKAEEKTNINGKQVSRAPAIAMLLNFVEQSIFDDIDMINPGPRLLKREYTCASNQCYRKKCRYFKKCCFAHGPRDYSQEVNLIVTNYSLLLRDALSGGRILPEIKNFIFDEAHCLEEEAREAFCRDLDETKIKEIVERVSSINNKTCIFEIMKKKFMKSKDKDSEKLFFALNKKAQKKADDFSRTAVDLAVNLRGFSFFDSHPRSSYESEKVWLDSEIKTSELWKKSELLLLKMKEEALVLINSCQDIVAFLDDYPKMAESIANLSNLIFDLKEITETSEALFNQGSDYFNSVTISRRKSPLPFSFNANAYDVGDILNRHLYRRLDSALFTSATLKVDRSFENFRSTTGLSEGIRELTIGSSFDYDVQMTVYVPTNVPSPKSTKTKENEEYLQCLSELCAGAIRAQEGSMLILFTSRAEMERVFLQAKEKLKDSQLPLLIQKKGVSTKWLGDQFIEENNISLFALKSFWEGFDAPGETLRGVIIAKLPFSKPTDPLTKERALREGGNVFMKYALPKTVLEVRQAAGRLIRSKSDKGNVILADSRINSNSYGRIILNSLPTDDIRFLSTDDIVKSIEIDNS